ncbi:DUF3145 domain-containing protein [Propioniciclava soli]|uniref:DUF3145 domain-containing protein n=1 Tax=Propioniciclava soli TaxID=2775081 RepID=UPI001E402AF3|nr:DUF3145 domain-containing protein [Propioniciclava soli]
MTTTRGVLHIHSAPSALCPHIEWAVAGALGVPVDLAWAPQPAERASYRAELAWRGPVGTATRLASLLKRWGRLRFEITEEATPDSEAERYSFTPALGVFHATVGLHGDIVVPEDRIRHALASATDERALRGALDDLLGRRWDAELDVFRHAAEGVPLRWLHDVG